MKIIPAATFKKFETQFKFNPKVGEKTAFSDRSAMFKAVDQAAGQLVEGATAKVGTFPDKLQQQVLEELQPDTQASIGTIQNIFGKPGISIAICGENHKYKDGPPDRPKKDPIVQAAKEEVKTWNSKNPQNQFTLKAYVKDDNPDYWKNDVKPRMRQYAARKLGFEDEVRRYRLSVQDQSRAQSLILLAGGATEIQPDLVILERGLKHGAPTSSQKFVKEEDLINTALSIKQRSAVIAAYLFLCAAGGDRSDNFRVLIFIGEEHKDLVDCFEELAQYSAALPWVKDIKRNYGLLPSHVVN